ncbi:transglutaminase domain-containing protein [Streptomyces clavuligerus]|nr:transglutaminase domain-containing protein [Streptomyces clavuligerus]WDN53373.1 Ig domain-containing protein [Streptomyces clavuligerus]
MRDQERSRNDRVPDARVPGRRPAGRGVAGLQAGVGNAAVVQMLRGIGHPWAQEAGRDGREAPGTAPDPGAAAVVQRMESAGTLTVPVVEQVDLAGTVPVAEDGESAAEQGLLISSATYRKDEVPTALVRIDGLGGFGGPAVLEAADVLMPGGVLGRSQEVNPLGDTHTFVVPLLGLPGQGAVGNTLAFVEWRLVRGDGVHNVGSSSHHVYRLFDTPTCGQARAQAVREATVMAQGRADPQEVAVALRQGVRARVDYDPEDSINDDPLTVLDDGVGICTDLGNLHVLLAQTLGLFANAVMYWGGFMSNGRNIWVTDGDGQSLADVRATDNRYHPNQGEEGWDFSYHAIARIDGVLHDAALDREGIDARAVHQGLQVAFDKIVQGVLPDARVGEVYQGLIGREMETVAITVQDYGDRVGDAEFQGLAMEVPPGTTDMFFAGLLDVVGSLPPGLVLFPQGTIVGTPTAPGEYTFAVRVFADVPPTPLTIRVF